MKTAIKILVIILSFIFIAIFGFMIYSFILTKDVKIDKDKLINLNHFVTFYDIDNNEIKKESKGKTMTIPDEIPEITKKAFIAIEDKRFYSHNGTDLKGLIRALVNNIKSLSLKEGASTITQQLIKNTHLTNEKTLKRKLSEIKLAHILEKHYSKDEIINMYLNTIYFGENCYGITCACDYYFNKKPMELSLNESCVLAGIIKAPSTYNPIKNYDKCNKRKNVVLHEMLKENFITENEYDENINKKVIITEKNRETSNFNYFYLVKNELRKLSDNLPYYTKNLKVYTNYNPQLNKIIENQVNNNDKYEKSAILINKNGEINAYYSTCGNIKRQPGSIIKPILVYGPAINEDKVSEMTVLNDEKTNFNGYTPSNYNDKYYGYISVKQSLAKSSNVCAVKLLNSIGIEKAKSYINKTDAKLSKEDNSLSIALGSLTEGVTLKDIASAYNVFNNQGYYISPYTIREIRDDNDKVVFKKTKTPKKVFDNETVSIMNDCLRYTVTNGTAKKLSFLNYPIYSKTGTVGNKYGNSDAYNISYTDNYVCGVWIGSEKELMTNNITGGTTPTLIAKSIWQDIYKNKAPEAIPFSKNIKEILLDKITYESEHKTILADSISPPKYTIKALEKEKNIMNYNKSSLFSFPIIEKPYSSVNNKSFTIYLCQTYLYNYKIIREENGIKKEIYDSISDKNKSKFTDKNLEQNKTYSYYIVPYYLYNNKRYMGKVVFIDTIKTPNYKFGDDWLTDDFG